MRKKNKKIKLIKAVKQTTIEMLSSIKYGIIEELEKIAIVFQILIPVIIASSDVPIPTMIVASAAFILCVRYVINLSYNINHRTERGLPIPVKRFTYIDERGFVNVEDTQEAILYLNALEDSMEKKGWIGVDKHNKM